MINECNRTLSLSLSLSHCGVIGFPTLNRKRKGRGKEEERKRKGRGKEEERKRKWKRKGRGKGGGKEEQEERKQKGRKEKLEVPRLARRNLQKSLENLKFQLLTDVSRTRPLNRCLKPL